VKLSSVSSGSWADQRGDIVGKLVKDHSDLIFIEDLKACMDVMYWWYYMERVCTLHFLLQLNVISHTKKSTK
jgi:hypothetical protein